VILLSLLFIICLAVSSVIGVMVWALTRDVEYAEHRVSLIRSELRFELDSIRGANASDFDDEEITCPWAPAASELCEDQPFA
jgi:hypothetical protein